MVRVKVKQCRVRLERDPLRLRVEYDLVKVKNSAAARNSNLAPIKEVVGVVKVKELVSAVVRTAILPRSLGNDAATVQAAIGRELCELSG